MYPEHSQVSVGVNRFFKKKVEEQTRMSDQSKRTTSESGGISRDRRFVLDHMRQLCVFTEPSRLKLALSDQRMFGIFSDCDRSHSANAKHCGVSYLQ